METVPVPPRPGLQYFGRVRDANENMGKARYVAAVRIEPRCEAR